MLKIYYIHPLSRPLIAVAFGLLLQPPGLSPLWGFSRLCSPHSGLSSHVPSSEGPPPRPAGPASPCPAPSWPSRPGCACARAPRASMSRAPPRPPTQPLEKCGAALGTLWGLSGVRQRHKRGIAPCHVRAPRCPEPPFEDP